MINLTDKETNYFWNYITAAGYCFEVEEKNSRYKDLVTRLDGKFEEDSHYYPISNKWGCQCRLYLYNFENFPDDIKNKIVSSYGYGGSNGSRNNKYTIRISDTDFLLKLVKNYGLRVGEYESGIKKP